MSNEKIELKVVIDDTQIVITGGGTSFISMGLMPKYDLKDLKKQRARVARLAKEKGIKISYKGKTKQAIENSMDTYQVAYLEYYTGFHLLKALWTTKAQKGIYVGFSEDKDLKAISQANQKVNALWNTGSVLGIVHSVAVRLRDLEREVNNTTNFSQITL